MSGFLLLILVASTLGYAFSVALSNPGAQQAANNQDVDTGQNQYGYKISYQGRDIYLSSSVDEVKDIPIDVSFGMIDYAQMPLYIDSDNSFITQEIASTIGPFTSRTSEACYGSCDKDLPEKDCSENIIIYTESKENKVYQKEKCVFIEGNLITADAFLYKIFGY